MKSSPHILWSEDPLTEGQNQDTPCGRELHNAGWVKTDGDLRNSQEWMMMLAQSCKKCRIKFGELGTNHQRMNVYFALDGELLLSARERTTDDL